MIEIALFIAGSGILIALSWRSLRCPGSHGFYRFFAWEAILALLLMNAAFWFYRPFAWNQILAWSLLFLSLLPLAFGVHSLRTRGKPSRERKGDPTLLEFEKTSTLVTSGIYHYIRHPLYSSLLLLAWGIFFKLPSGVGIFLVVTSTVLLIGTAKADEIECIRFFGAPYQEYMKKTKRFVPYLFAL